MHSVKVFTGICWEGHLYLCWAAAGLGYKSRCRQKMEESFWHLSRETQNTGELACTNHHPQGNWHYHSRNVLICFYFQPFYLIWVHHNVHRSILNHTRKIQRRLMLQYVRLQEPPAGGAIQSLRRFADLYLVEVIQRTSEKGPVGHRGGIRWVERLMQSSNCLPRYLMAL